jgi:hypothetical protein
VSADHGGKAPLHPPLPRWRTTTPPPRSSPASQHHPFLIVGASEHGKLGAVGSVLRDSALNHVSTLPSLRDAGEGDPLHPHRWPRWLPGGADIALITK